ncbi:hypothetical protein Tco_1450295, partial [Tanacetum coccineum]
SDFVALAESAKFKDMAGLSSMLQFLSLQCDIKFLSVFRVVSLVIFVGFKETTALYSVVEPISLSIFRVVSLVNSVEFKETIALSSMVQYLLQLHINSC